MENSAGEAVRAAPPDHWLDRLEALLGRIARAVSALGVLGMLVAAAATVIDVTLRWLISGGMIALNEIIAFSFAIAVAACIPAGAAGRVNLSVDVLSSVFSPRTEALQRSIGAILLFVFFALLTWQLALHTEALFEQGRRTIILRLYLWPFITGSTVLIGFATLVQGVVAANTVRQSLAVRPDARPVGPGAAILNVLFMTVAVLVVVLAGLMLYDMRSVSYWVQDHAALALILIFVFAWVLLLAMVPLAAVVGLVGIVGGAYFIGFKPNLSALASEAVGFLSNYQVASLPLFLMMGSFAVAAGVAEDIYRLAHAIFGARRGGLLMATVGGCAGFGTISGSSLATVATFGRVALPEMQSRGYSPSLSLGCVAAGGTLGALIPPSAVLIVFALLTEASIGQLFVAAVVPGVLAVLLYLVAIFVTVRVDPGLVPPAQSAESGAVFDALKKSGAVVLLFGAVIGGMYTGVFTATEAAAVGAFGAFLIALFRGRLKPANFWHVMAETTSSTALIYGIIFGVLIFALFVDVSELAVRFSAFIADLDVRPVLIVLLILAIYVALGCLMDSWTIMFITVPVVTPVVLGLGYDLIWWGIINLVVIEIGQITPPFGLNLFVLKGMTNTALGTVYRGVLPFCIADFIKLFILVLLPALSLWLPSTMFR